MHTEEEEEGKEAEPRLKYSPFYPSSTTTVSSGESLNFSCCAATDRFVALGSLDGKVILMDAQGNIIKVGTELCWDTLYWQYSILNTIR